MTRAADVGSVSAADVPLVVRLLFCERYRAACFGPARW